MISRFLIPAAGAIAIALGLAPMRAAAGITAYSINFSGQFGTIDLGTGAFTPVGPGTVNTPDGIGGAAGGPFYTVDGTTGHLLRISTAGAVTDVGDTGTGPNVGPGGVSVMGSLTNGALYAIDFSNNLYSLSAVDGSATLLGLVSGLPTQDFNYTGSMTSSFNGTATNIFMTLEVSFGPNTTGPTLFNIDPLTLLSSATPLIANGAGRLIGSGYIDGVLYGFTEFGEIVTIDTSTGVETIVAHYDSGSTPDAPGPPFTGLFGAVAAPEPGAWLLTLSGAGLALMRRQRRGAA